MYIIGTQIKGLHGDKCFQFSAHPHVHSTKGDADTEAVRLAKAYPGKTFVVFQAISQAFGKVTVEESAVQIPLLIE